MPHILAHRGNADGPSLAEQNSLPAVAHALKRGWGLEIDIRRADDGQFYVSHDPLVFPDGLAAEAYCAELRHYPHATVALNIKECGSEADLLAFLAEECVLEQMFLFDMELIEPNPGEMARRFHAIDPTARLAARVSDRSESIERALEITSASVIWLDEFDTLWATETDVRRLKAAGRSVYAVSPELHHFPLHAARARWIDFCRWGIDGICTDYPAELERLIESMTEMEPRDVDRRTLISRAVA